MSAARGAHQRPPLSFVVLAIERKPDYAPFRPSTLPLPSLPPHSRRYARQLEQQIREKEASKKQARVDRITDEKQYLSPADKQHTKPVHVSPAYEDHIASTLHPRGYTEHAQPSQPTYDSNQPQNNAAADAKQQYVYRASAKPARLVALYCSCPPPSPLTPPSHPPEPQVR